MAETANSPPSGTTQKHSVLDSSFPVSLPEFRTLARLAAETDLQAVQDEVEQPSGDTSVQQVTNDLKTLDTADDTEPVDSEEVSRFNLKRPAPTEADNPRP
jgi:hypothetical protein